MFYHGYLMSEAVAYPVFLVAVAVIARALAGRSNRLALEVPAVCLLAIATRVQFLILPLAYLVGVAVCGRGAYRRHGIGPARCGFRSYDRTRRASKFGRQCAACFRS